MKKLSFSGMSLALILGYVSSKKDKIAVKMTSKMGVYKSYVIKCEVIN